MTRVLGVDLGTVRVGLAVSDPGGVIATPLDVIPRDDAPGEIARRAVELEIDAIVVGLPLSMDGSHGPAADAAEAFARTLEQETALPVTRFDERLSTVEAQRAMRATGKKAKQQRGQIDKIAATLFLQTYLDSRRAS